MSQKQDPDTILKERIKMDMRSFWNWVLAKKLDPTPVISEPLSITVEQNGMNIAGKFWNHSIKGHGFSEGYCDVLGVNVANRCFEVVVQNLKVTVEGDYEMEGELPNGASIKKSGHFSAPSWRTHDSNSRISVMGFTIKQDGFIDLSTAEITYKQFISIEDLILEGFDLDEYIEDEQERYKVKSALRRGYAEQIDFVKIFPMSHFAVKYLQEVFNEEPIKGLKTL